MFVPVFDWENMKRWERRELARALRRAGLSYGEIRALIPVSKGTLSGWCQDIQLTEEQRAAVYKAWPVLSKQEQLGVLLRDRAKARRDEVRARGRREAADLISDPFWTAGLVAYWSEGNKRTRSLGFSNSDPALLVLFLDWCKRFLGVDSEDFIIRLHLHSGQVESERRSFWSNVTGLSHEQFRKAYIKSEGTGHRKNVLYQGTAQVLVRRSGGLFQRVLGWIDCLEERWKLPVTFVAGR